MTRPVTLDLDDPGHVERVWQEIHRRFVLRNVDPELRAAIERRCERLDPAVAAPIQASLDQVAPEVVAESYFRELVPDMRTIGWWVRNRTGDGI